MAKEYESGKICSLQQGFVISSFFSIYFLITGAKNIVLYTESMHKCTNFLS